MRRIDTVVLDPISQDIRPHGGHLAPPTAGIAPALGERCEAVGGFDQSLAQAAGRGRIEGLDVFDDRFEMSDGLVGPDDGPQAGVSAQSPARGRGSRVPVPHEASQRRTAP